MEIKKIAELYYQFSVEKKNVRDEFEEECDRYEKEHNVHIFWEEGLDEKGFFPQIILETSITDTGAKYVTVYYCERDVENCKVLVEYP